MYVVAKYVVRYEYMSQLDVGTSVSGRAYNICEMSHNTEYYVLTITWLFQYFCNSLFLIYYRINKVP